MREGRFGIPAQSKNPAVIAKRQAFETHFNRLCSESFRRFEISLIFFLFLAIGQTSCYRCVINKIRDFDLSLVGGQFSSVQSPAPCGRGFFCQTAHLVAVKNPAVILKHQAFEAHFNRLCSESEQWWNLF